MIAKVAQSDLFFSEKLAVSTQNAEHACRCTVDTAKERLEHPPEDS